MVMYTSWSSFVFFCYNNVFFYFQIHLLAIWQMVLQMALRLNSLCYGHHAVHKVNEFLIVIISLYVKFLNQSFVLFRLTSQLLSSKGLSTRTLPTPRPTHRKLVFQDEHLSSLGNKFIYFVYIFIVVCCCCVCVVVVCNPKVYSLINFLFRTD